jgi:hypothetical protein
MAMTIFGKPVIFTDKVPPIGARNRRRLAAKAERQFAEHVAKVKEPDLILFDPSDYRPDAKFED